MLCLCVCVCASPLPQYITIPHAPTEWLRWRLRASRALTARLVASINLEAVSFSANLHAIASVSANSLSPTCPEEAAQVHGLPVCKINRANPCFGVAMRPFPIERSSVVAFSQASVAKEPFSNHCLEGGTASTTCQWKVASLSIVRAQVVYVVLVAQDHPQSCNW